VEENGYDPVVGLEGPLTEAWENPGEPKQVVWPIFMRVGRSR
jgi:hypothetical protein